MQLHAKFNESPSPRQKHNHSNYLAVAKGKPIFDAQFAKENSKAQHESK
jgi:hypothetical protein